MKIMTTARRAGGSTHELEGSKYHFKPDAKSGDVHVCDVTIPAHIKRFLSIDAFSVFGADEEEPKVKGTDNAQTKPATHGPTASAPAAPAPLDNPVLQAAAQAAPATDAVAGMTVTPLEDLSRDELVAIHQETFGKKPHHKWTEEKIIAAIRDVSEE